MRKKRDLYDELGVERNAPPDKIKRQYRKRANQTHPDKGGNPDEFRAVARAYEVLSSEELRAKYDRGESVEEKSEDAKLWETLSSIFVQVVEAIDPAFENPFDKVRQIIRTGQNDALEQIKKTEEATKKLERSRERITAKGKSNLFAHVLDQRIGQYRSSIAEMARQRALGDKMLAIVAEYEYRKDERDPAKGGYYSFQEFFAPGAFK